MVALSQSHRVRIRVRGMAIGWWVKAIIIHTLMNHMQSYYMCSFMCCTYVVMFNYVCACSYGSVVHHFN